MVSPTNFYSPIFGGLWIIKQENGDCMMAVPSTLLTGWDMWYFCSWPWELWSPDLAVFKWVGLGLMVSICAVSEKLLAWTGTTPSLVWKNCWSVYPNSSPETPAVFQEIPQSWAKPIVWMPPDHLPKSCSQAQPERRNRYGPKETGKLGQEVIKWDAAWKTKDCYIWERKQYITLNPCTTQAPSSPFQKT